MSKNLTRFETIPVSIDENISYKYNLEALRGFAALLVVWCHAVGFERLLDPNYKISGISAYEPPAHFSVLLFFIISGYVIGLTNKRPIVANWTAKYVKKRMVRIYPIYFISLLFTLLVARHYTIGAWLGSFSFLQIILTPVIWENSPSWSLHYEIIFYILFIPIWLLDSRISTITIIIFIIGVFNLVLFPAETLISSYSFGFVFWLAGLYLSRYDKFLTNANYSTEFLVSILLLIFSMRNFNYGETIFKKLLVIIGGNHLFYDYNVNSFTAMVSLYDFSSLPYCLLFIVIFLGKKFKYIHIYIYFILCLRLLFSTS